MSRILIVILVCLLAGGLFYWAFRQAPGGPEDAIPAAASPATSTEQKRIETIAVRMPEGTSQDAAVVVERKPVDLTIPKAMRDFDLWLRAYMNSAPEARGGLLDAGRELLPARSQAMADLIAFDPQAAILTALSPTERALLPADFQSQVEQMVAGQGFYGVKAICNHGPEVPHDEQTCRIEYEAGIGDTLYKASIYGSRRDRLTEEKASLYGVAHDGRIALHEDDYVVLPGEDIDPARSGQLAVIHNGVTTWFPDLTALESSFQQPAQP